MLADEDAIASKSLPNRAILISIKILVLKEKITQRNFFYGTQSQESKSEVMLI